VRRVNHPKRHPSRSPCQCSGSVAKDDKDNQLRQFEIAA
jgi:hypothetical protein